MSTPEVEHAALMCRFLADAVCGDDTGALDPIGSTDAGTFGAVRFTSTPISSGGARDQTWIADRSRTRIHTGFAGLDVTVIANSRPVSGQTSR